MAMEHGSVLNPDFSSNGRTPLEKFRNLADFLIGRLGVSRLQGLLQAMLKMRLKNTHLDIPKCGHGRAKLNEDVYAIALVSDHPLQAPKLALHFSKSRQ